MIKPKALEFGDTIGVIAPASPTSKANIKKAEKKLVEMGFKVKMGESCFETYGYLSGTDDIRARDLNNMFADEEVSGIICMRGGYGTPRLLELIDYELIKRNPKVFVGYSDITALHIAITQLSNLVTFHGPMVAADLIGDVSEFTQKSLYNSILKGEFSGDIDNPDGEDIVTINGGMAEGPIIGGNLSLVVDTLRTPYEIDVKGKILFLEEIGEESYQIDRMFNQLRLSGLLEEAEGIILGDFHNCGAEISKHPDSLTLEQVIDDLVRPVNKPTIYNLQSGHCEPMITLPFGVNARLDADKGQLTILEMPKE